MARQATKTREPGKKSSKKRRARVLGAKKIKSLPGPFGAKIVKLIEENAFDMVENAVRKGKEGDYRAMKYLFDLLGRFESQVPPERRNSLARVLLKHLGLTEEMIAAEQAAEDDDPPAQGAERNR
jgi:hypothetical protein